MRRLASLLVLVAALGACDRGGRAPAPVGEVSSPETGLAMAVGFDEPLRAGGQVTWRLHVSNRGREPVTLRFASGKDGDVVLGRDGREVYRWSAKRLFSQALREVPLAPGATVDFELDEPSLAVPAGDYDLVAELAATPSPGALRRPVTVRR